MPRSNYTSYRTRGLDPLARDLDPCVVCNATGILHAFSDTEGYWTECDNTSCTSRPARGLQPRKRPTLVESLEAFDFPLPRRPLVVAYAAKLRFLPIRTTLPGGLGR